MKLNICIFDKRLWIIRKIYLNLGKVKNSIKKEFDSEPVSNEKYLKAYNGKINTNFQNNKMPKEGSPCICYSVIWSILFSGQVKIIILKCLQKMPEYITDDIEVSVDDSDREDQENSDQENSNEEN